MTDNDQPAEHDYITHDDAAFVEAEVVDEAPTPEPIVDAGDAPGDEVAPGETDKADLNQFGENLARAAADAAYATVGLVDLVSGRVKEFYADQKKQYSKDHPEFEGEPDVTHLLSRVGEQVDRFVGDVSATIRDLADRGRASSKRTADDVAEKAEDLADGAAAAASDLADQVSDAAQEAADRVEASADAAAQHAGDTAHEAAEQAQEFAAEHGESSEGTERSPW